MRTLLGVVALSASVSWSFAAEPEKAAAPLADTAPLLTKQEAAEVDSVVAAMIAAGFPDAKGATVYEGPLSVRVSYDPSKTPPPLPTNASKMQMTGQKSNLTTYGYEFDGLNFKLADGSWIVALAFHFKPNAGDEVDTSQATEVKLDSLTADAIKAFPFDAEKNAANWLKRIAPAQRDLSARSMNRLVPLTQFLKLNPEDLVPATVLLHRAGWKDAAELSLAISNQRARSYWQLRSWTKPDWIFDPTGEYPGIKDEQAAWEKEHEQFTAEPPAVALRRALFRWCRAQMGLDDPEDALLPKKVAAATAKAALDPHDPQANAARIDAMLASAGLPIEPAKGADLAARLQSWEARPRMPKMTVSGGNVQNGSVSMSTTFSAPVSAYTPDKKDLDALVALLADERPSRFVDFSGARPVADDAWRALAILLKDDPRKLAGYPTDRAWTPAERRAAASAVQKWWKENRAEFVEK